MSNDLTPISVCPRCHSTRIIPILYGLPSSQASACAEQGDFLLGGQVIEADSPWWACQFCYNRFQKAVPATHPEDLLQPQEVGSLL